MKELKDFTKEELERYCWNAQVLYFCETVQDIKYRIENMTMSVSDFLKMSPENPKNLFGVLHGKQLNYWREIIEKAIDNVKFHQLA